VCSLFHPPGLEEISSDLRTSLGASLRVSDEAIVLPSASRSVESGAYKNVVFRLSGDNAISSELFSSDWGGGVSIIEVPTDIAEPLLADSKRRNAALKKLREIPSELADADISIGPGLEGDEDDRDLAGWKAGLDAASACVGLYSAKQMRAPEPSMSGFSRAHSVYFLVCRAGGGLAAQTFHSRLTTALRGGKSLDECLSKGSMPGEQALRRVGLAGSRNRARILAVAATALGFHQVDTIGDSAAFHEAPHRGAIPCIDVSINTLRRVEGARSVYQYSAGCIDTTQSQGLVSSSNVAEGFLMFVSGSGEYRFSFRNDAHDTVPFVTPRLKANRDLATVAATEHVKAKLGQVTTTHAHPDRNWLKQRFTWKSKDVGSEVDFEPSCLWGSHGCEAFISNWARELGLATCQQVRLAPELVCLAALEPAKLRAMAKKVAAATSAR
jgi:hypothetical protein